MEYSVTSMGISPSIILAILFLLGFLAFILGLVWLAYKLSTIFYRWLSQRKFVIEFRQRREARKKAISRKRKMGFGEFLAEVFAEPVILTIAIVIAYDHFKGIWDTSPDFATFWLRINETTRGNLLVAIFLTIALILWVSVIVLRRNREEQRDKVLEELLTTNNDKLAESLRTSSQELKDSLQTNSERMGQIVEGIKELAEEIRRDREDKHGKSPTDM